MNLEPGTTVAHPQWGRGTVLFDKAHCLAIRFVGHGQVNFTQEEWASQHSPSERFRGILSLGGRSESELEYALQSAVENGDMSEQEASRLLERRVHSLEVKRRRRPNLNEAYELYRAHPGDQFIADDFYQALLRYIAALVRQQASDPTSYDNVEDSIQDSALEVWRSLERFDATKSPFKNWVKLVTIRNVRDAFRRFRTRRGNRSQPTEDLEEALNHQVPLEAEETASDVLPQDKQLLLKEFLEGLPDEDRTILQMSMDGLTTREMAEALGTNAMAISRRLRRLRTVTKPPF